MLSRPDIEMIMFLAVIFAAMLIITLLINLWDPWGRRFFVRWFGVSEQEKVDSARSALNRLKRASIIYSILIAYLILFQLPRQISFVSPEKLTIEEVAAFQARIASDLGRMREVIYLSLYIGLFWGWGAYNALKEILSGAEKKLGQKAAPKESEYLQ